MAMWEWKPVRKWSHVDLVLSQGSENEKELAAVLQKVVAGAEHWSDRPGMRHIVLGFEQEVPQALVELGGKPRVARALERLRTGRWGIECCAFDESQVLGFRTHPLGPRLAPTPFGEIPLFARDLWVDDFVRDLRRWFARNMVFAENLEVDEGLLFEEFSWLEDWGVWPTRVIERWPTACWVDLIVHEPNLVDSWKQSKYMMPGLVPSVFGWLSDEVVKHLGMPCELRLVRWPTGQLESMEGQILGKEPEKEAMEQLQAKASKCRSQPEVQFFWAAVKAHLLLEPGFPAMGFELDFAHPDLRIGVEIDGAEWHSEYGQRERDYARDRKLQSEGWKVLRYTARQVLNDPESCVRDVKKNLRLSPFRFRQQLGM